MRLEVLYYPLFVLFNFNVALLGVIFPHLFLALINEILKYTFSKVTYSIIPYSDRFHLAWDNVLCNLDAHLVSVRHVSVSPTEGAPHGKFHICAWNQRSWWVSGKEDTQTNFVQIQSHLLLKTYRIQDKTKVCDLRINSVTIKITYEVN